MLTSDRMNHLFLYDNTNDKPVVVPFKMFGKLIKIDKTEAIFSVVKDVLNTWDKEQFIIRFDLAENLKYVGPGSLDDYPEYLL